MICSKITFWFQIPCLNDFQSIFSIYAWINILSVKAYLLIFNDLPKRELDFVKFSNRNFCDFILLTFVIPLSTANRRAF